MGCTNIQRQQKYQHPEYRNRIQYPWETQWGRYCDQISSNQPLIQIRDRDLMKKRLHRFQVAIIWEEPISKKKMKGSGLLISRNLVLTCAHNFYFTQRKQITANYSIQIYPGQLGQLFRSSKVEQLYIPKQYRKNPQPANAEYDYALVKLTQTVEMREFIPLIWDYKDKIHQKVAIFGYPGSSYKKRLNQPLDSVYQEGQSREGTIQIDESDQTLNHSIPTMHGQSGSPLILCEPLDTTNVQSLAVIGIHKGQKILINKQIKCNLARRLTKQLIQELEVQALKMRAQMFLSSNINEEMEATSQKTSQELFQRAKRHQRNKLYSNAFICYQQLLRRQVRHSTPFKALISNYYGICLNELELYEEASIQLKLALNLNQDLNKNLQIYGELGHALNQTKKFNQTVNILQQALQQGYLSANIYNCLGLAKKELKNSEEAIGYFQKAIAIEKKYLQAHYNLANAYRHKKQYQIALKYYNKSIQINKNFAEGYCGLGNICYAQKKWDQAIYYYKKSIEVNPYYESGYSNLANTFKEIKQTELAIQYYSKIIKINPNYKYGHHNLAMIYKDNQQYEHAIHHFQMFVNIDPKNSGGYNNLGTAYFLVKKYDQAITHYEKAFQLKPDNFEALFNLGNTQMQQEKYAQALYSYTKAIDLRPQHLQTHFQMGLAHKGKNNLPFARLSFEKCINIYPSHWMSHFQIQEIDLMSRSVSFV